MHGKSAVTAARNRRLQGQCLLWFGTEIAVEEAFRDSGICVLEHLLLATKNAQPAFSREELEADFDLAYDPLYAGSEDDPYEGGLDWRGHGMTIVMAEWVCRKHGILLQVQWLRTKIMDIKRAL